MSNHGSPLQPTCTSSNPENIVDLFADVSHHGSSLFLSQLFALPPTSIPPAVADQAEHPALVTAQHDITPTSQSPHSTGAAQLPSARNSIELVDSNTPCTEPSILALAHPPMQTPAPPPVFPSPSKPPPPRPAIAKRASRQRKGTATPAPSGPKLLAPATDPLPPNAHTVKPPRRNRTSPKATAPPIRPRPPPISGAQDESGASDASDESPLSLSSKRAPRPLESSLSLSARSQPSIHTPKQATNSNVDSSNPSDPPARHSHNSHTRRCRAKVNTKFQELLAILPTPPASTGIKHKAQILDYTIRVFRDIHARKTLLEAELALSSRAHLDAWVDGIVSRSLSLQDLLAPYLSLICTKGSWKYSEAWVCSQDPSPLDGLDATTGVMSNQCRTLSPNTSSIGITSKLRLGIAVIPSLGNSEDPNLQVRLERFRDKSRPYGCKPRIDLPGRILCTMRPEWLPSLEDNEAFQRSGLATDASLVMCFGVPVFVRGNVAAVALFFDTEQRPYDAKSVDLADNVASLLGSSFGASAMKSMQCR